MRTTRDLSTYVHATSIADFSPAVVERAKTLAASALASAVLGADMHVSRLMTDYAMETSAPGDVTLVGTSLTSSVGTAAMLNAVYSHCTELEDVAWPDATYTCFLMPAVFSIAEALGASGARTLEALILGYEITSRPGITITDGGAQTRGWLACAVNGAVGAAGAAAKLMRLDEEQTLHALAIAASFGAGLNRQTGSGAHVIEAGMAARNGVAAATLAARGLTGNPTILEGKAGLWDALSGHGEIDFELGTGDDLRVMAVGMKKYPCCYLSQRIIDGVLELRDMHGLTLENVSEVEVGVSRAFPQILKYPAPTNPEEARFSLPHIMSSALAGESMFFDTFTDEKVRDARLVAGRDKVRTIVHDEWGEAQMGPLNTLTIRTVDGRELTRDCRTARGDPSDPLTTDDLRRRFKACTDSVLGDTRSNEALAALMALDTCGDVRQLMPLLAV